MSAPVRRLSPRTGTTAIRDTSAQDVVRDAGPRRRRRMIVAAVALVALAAGLFMILRSDWWSVGRAVPLERVRIATIERGPLTRDVQASGIVTAAVSPSVYAPSAGTVTLNVKAGDLVEAGQILAVVESPDLSSTLAQEEATLESLATNLSRRGIEQKQQALRSRQLVDLARMDEIAARRELRRAEAAWEIKVISRQDLEKAQDDVQKAEVELAHAESAAQLESESMEFEYRTLELERDRQALVVEELNRRVADLRVHAPVSGMVGTVAVEQTAAVAENQPLASVVDLSALEVEANIPESYADDLRVGMPAQVMVGAERFDGILRAISPEVRNNTVAGRIRFAGETPAGLRQNQRVTVSVSLEAIDDTLTVQRGPFLDSGAGRVIYVVEGDVATRRTIRTGASSGTLVEIVSGVAEGERVVISSVEPFRGAERVLLSD